MTPTDVVTAMSLFGIPSIFAMTAWCVKTCIKYTKQIQILMKAQQAQMRAELLTKYRQYKQAGRISQEDLDEWENQYQSYHALGKNGVLDARREELFKLPQ